MKLFFLYSFFCYSISSFACSCAFQDLDIEIERSDLIFTGTVLSKEILRDKVKYQISSSKIWKGPKADEYSVYTGISGADCGINLEIGKTYLIWSYRENPEQLRTSSCTRTDLLVESIALDYLNRHFQNEDYPEQRLALNEKKIIAKRLNMNLAKLDKLSLYYSDERLITKGEFINMISYHAFSIHFIEFDKNELTELTKSAKYGMLMVSFREKIRPRRIFRTLKKASG